MLRRDRERWGMRVGGEPGGGSGSREREYAAIEDAERPPTSTEYEAICESFGWPDAKRQ
jgi:hypothetical protein